MIESHFYTHSSAIDELYTAIESCESIIPLTLEANTALLNFMSIYEWQDSQGRVTTERDIQYDAFILLFTYAKELGQQIDEDQFEVKGGSLKWII